MNPNNIDAVRTHKVLSAMAWEQNPAASLEEHMQRMANILREPAQYEELWRRVDKSQEPRTGTPTIVCLCGSTKFWSEYLQVNQRETLAGNIVLTVGFFVHPEATPTGIYAAYREVTTGMKAMLDELHLRKIDLADEVYIINRDGYMGESTRAELAYARAQNKTIRSLEPLGE